MEITIEAPKPTTAIAKRKNGTARSSAPDQLLAIIERVACDPAADIGKMRELLVMRAQIHADAAVKLAIAAMMAAQAEMEPIRADAKNEQTKSRYATYPALDAAARPIYTKHGFALTFDTETSKEPNCVRVVCDVMHIGGHTRRYGVDMPADGKGAKGGEVMTRTHATGAAISYGQRYLVLMIFNIAVDKDMDGNGAAPPSRAPSGFITDEQATTILDLIADVGADTRRFCGHFKIDGVTKLRADQFQRAVDMLNAKKPRAQ